MGSSSSSSSSNTIEDKACQDLNEKIEKTAQEETIRLKNLQERVKNVQQSKSFLELLQLWKDVLGRPTLDKFCDVVEKMHNSTMDVLNLQEDICKCAGQATYDKLIKLFYDYWQLLSETENTIKKTKMSANIQKINIGNLLNLINDGINNNNNKKIEEISLEYNDRMKLLLQWIDQESIQSLKKKWMIMVQQLKEMKDEWVQKTKQSWLKYSQKVLTALGVAMSSAASAIIIIQTAFFFDNGLEHDFAALKYVVSTSIMNTPSFAVGVEAATCTLVGIGLIQFAYSFWKGYQSFNSIIKDADQINLSLQSLLQNALEMDHTLNALLSTQGIIKEYINIYKNSGAYGTLKDSLTGLICFLDEYIQQTDEVIKQVEKSKQNVIVKF